MSKRIKEILNKMTLDEKIGQLNQVVWDNSEELKKDIESGKIGSLILANSSTAGNDVQCRANKRLLDKLQEIAVEKSQSGIPMIFGRDVIHGHSIVMPIPLASAASFNPDLITQAYRLVTREAVNDGIHWTFSPMMDISRDPRWGRCIEGFGEDPYLASKMAVASIKGFQGENLSDNDSIAACAKHYICYGAVEGGRDYGKAEVSDYTLRNSYLKPFAESIKSGVATVMSSFNEISGQAVASSKYLLYDLLKNELGFDGFIISDWEAIDQLVSQGVAADKKDAAQLAANAQLDMDMVDKCYIDNLRELVDEGKVSEETIDEMVYRVLSVKERLGLFENPYIQTCDIDYNEYKQVAKKSSDESMVLLKNEGILPIDKDEKVLVIGPFAHEKRALLGSWTLDFDITQVDCIADAFKQRSEKVIAPEYLLWDYILPDLRNVDTVIIALGESVRVTGEANSLADISLPAEQLEFIKRIKGLNKKIIGILCFGRPVALQEAEPYFDAILYAWHSGTMAAHSIADIVYGAVNPSGKLPMTFPRCTGQIPIYYNYPALSRDKKSYYGQGESYHDYKSTPMYPFGFGLSYTEFEYSEPDCKNRTLSLEQLKNGEKFKIGISVKNIGTCDGAEIVQCYVHDVVSTMIRPLKELKGFLKKTIKSNESASFEFEIGYEELGFYNASGVYAVEPGEFEIYIGKDCTAEKFIVIRVTNNLNADIG